MAVGRLVPRYALWLELRDLGWDPDDLSREAIIEFHDRHLDRFLADHELLLAPREQRKLRRRLARIDPRHPTPEETLTRILAPPPR